MTNYVSNLTPVRLGPKMPFYLPLEKSKPCLSLKFLIEDIRHIMFKRNFVRNSLKIIVSKINLIKLKIN